MSIRMSQCPPPGKREPLGYTGPEAKGVGRPSPWTTDRQICPPDKLHHDQRKKWGRPCRYHAEGSLRILSLLKAAPPFPFAALHYTQKKPWHFSAPAHPGHQSVRTKTALPSVLIVEDHALGWRRKQLIGEPARRSWAGETGSRTSGSFEVFRLSHLDISMPELSGVEAIPRIREVAPGARIISFPCTPQPGMYARPESRSRRLPAPKRRTRTFLVAIEPAQGKEVPSALSSPGP